MDAASASTELALAALGVDQPGEAARSPAPAEGFPGLEEAGAQLGLVLRTSGKTICWRTKYVYSYFAGVTGEWGNAYCFKTLLTQLMYLYLRVNFPILIVFSYTPPHPPTTHRYRNYNHVHKI